MCRYYRLGLRRLLCAFEKLLCFSCVELSPSWASTRYFRLPSTWNEGKEVKIKKISVQKCLVGVEFFVQWLPSVKHGGLESCCWVRVVVGQWTREKDFVGLLCGKLRRGHLVCTCGRRWWVVTLFEREDSKKEKNCRSIIFPPCTVAIVVWFSTCCDFSPLFWREEKCVMADRWRLCALHFQL